MKPGKVLCCMFWFAILGINPAQNQARYKRWLCVLKQRLCNSCIINELKQKMYRVKDFPT